MKQHLFSAAALLLLSATLMAQDGPRRGRPQFDDSSLQPKTAYMVADAHLDTQWNWDIQTTIRNYIPKTIRQNLHLLRTYPDYIFNFEGAIKYAWMKEYFPTEYEEMKKYIAEGRWHLTGTSWDAAETMVVSPESWLRNTLLGQTFFRQEYGKESTDIFLPDCFGFSYTLPTLAAHCGLIGFSSQKLGWRNHDFYEGRLRRYPFSVGLWQGIDGSRIMMAHGYGYGQTYRDTDLSENRQLLREMNESTLPEGYRYYGTGDTGGSPTIESVRAVMNGMKGNGPVKIVSATSDDLYKIYLPFDAHPELPVFDGELFMDVHGTGCYTSEAAMKFYNRQNEHLADAAERASVIAEQLGTTAYDSKALTDAWHRVILHQFHDDLTGTSIPRAYEFSWNDELISLKQFSSVLTTAVSGVASKMNTEVSGTPVVLYNTESFPRQAVAEVTLPDMSTAFTVSGPDGKRVPSQVVADANGEQHLLIDAAMPATGFSVYGVKAAGQAKAFAEKDVKEVENSVYRLRFDARGDICSLVDKRSGRELVKAGDSFGLVVFDDCTSRSWPAWEVLKATLDKDPVRFGEDATVRLVEDGDVRTTVRVTRQYGKSTVIQDVRLYKGAQADRIDVFCDVEWHSQNSLLKANFPFAFSNPEATYDLGLGSVKRGNNKENAYEVVSHEWTDLTASDESCGVTIFNDSKYGWDKPNDNTLRLSLLYVPKTGGGYSYQDRQDLGHHRFTYSIVSHEGALDKGAAVMGSTSLNSPLRAFTTSRHKGTLGRTYSFASSDNPNVTVRAIKKAEVGNEYVIRVYENSGKDVQKAHITFASPIVAASEADGTEKALGKAAFSGNQLDVEIRPFSVKTWRVTLADAATPAEKPQAPLTLPFNRRCFSTNMFRNGADFDGGHSYAAELLPEDGIIISEGIHYTLGDPEGRNGYTLFGDTIALPEGNYNKVYLLAASTRGDNDATITVLGNKGKKSGIVLSETTVNVPDYNAFIGQWGHDEHTTPFCKSAHIAYLGTHRHSGFEDEPYEYTMMFALPVELPAGATSIVLPADRRIVLFAATAVDDSNAALPAGALFRTGNVTDDPAATTKVAKTNLLKGATIVACTGEVNQRERAENIIDGNPETKWCDTHDAPNYVTLDMGSVKSVSGWRLLNAGIEASDYITRSCLLQGRANPTDEWQTLDLLDGNRVDDVERTFAPAKVRYIRLFIIGQAQEVGDDASRIYELEVYE